MRARPRRSRTSLIAVVSLVVLGCASVPLPQPVGVEQTPSTDKHRDTHNVLTSADLSSARVSTTIDALTRLRPEFLRGSMRGPLIGPPEVAVYLNNAYTGDVSVLNTIPLAAIREIDFLHPMEAITRFGTLCRCANGAIVVKTGRVETKSLPDGD